MSEQPILDALRRHARERPDAPVIVAGDETLSYGALARRVARAADELRALGVQTGDRVLLRMAAGCPDAPSLYLGTLASGGGGGAGGRRVVHRRSSEAGRPDPARRGRA